MIRGRKTLDAQARCRNKYIVLSNTDYTNTKWQIGSASERRRRILSPKMVSTARFLAKCSEISML